MREEPSFFNTEMPAHLPNECPECGVALNRRYAFYKKPYRITAFMERYRLLLAGIISVSLVSSWLAGLIPIYGRGIGGFIVFLIITPFLVIELLCSKLPNHQMVCCQNCEWEKKMDEDYDMTNPNGSN